MPPLSRGAKALAHLDAPSPTSHNLPLADAEALSDRRSERYRDAWRYHAVAGQAHLPRFLAARKGRSGEFENTPVTHL